MQCQIFKEQEKNKSAELQQNYYSEDKFIPADKIVCVGKYYPKHVKPFQNMDEFSNKILDIKNTKHRYQTRMRSITMKSQLNTLQISYRAFFQIHRNRLCVLCLLTGREQISPA